mmetsp:Transcript_34388/g.75286  ORF Transcript_34388/g.75286 Transcript_34388/m.75286 type:complete len:477 (+) Transcript_34388:270-1700(+)
MYSCQSITVVLVAVLASSLGGLPPAFRSSCVSSALGFLGRWDLAKHETERAIAALSQTNTDTSAKGLASAEDLRLESFWGGYFDPTEKTLLLQLIEINVAMEQFDEAIAIYLNEIVPQLVHALGENSFEVGVVFSFVAAIYRAKGDYEMGLEYLARAQELYLANADASVLVVDRAERTALMQKNQEDVEEMNELLDIVQEQEVYVSTYIDMARSWHFVHGIRHDVIPENNNCPGENERIWDRFYSPTFSFLVLPSTGLLLAWLLLKFVWIKPTRIRCTAALVVGIPLLFVILSYWGWLLESYTGRLNFVASLYKGIGKDEKALELFDEARCSILARPYEEVLLTQDVVLDTFMGPAYVFMNRGEVDAVDNLVKDIHGLMAADSGLLDPSFKMFSFYLDIAETYMGLGDEAKAEHFYSLVEKEGKALKRFISETAEEEIQKLLEPKSTKGANESSKLATEAEREEEESGPEITVGHI